MINISSSQKAFRFLLLVFQLFERIFRILVREHVRIYQLLLKSQLWIYPHWKFNFLKNYLFLNPLFSFSFHSYNLDFYPYIIAVSPGFWIILNFKHTVYSYNKQRATWKITTFLNFTVGNVFQDCFFVYSWWEVSPLVTIWILQHL